MTCQLTFFCSSHRNLVSRSAGRGRGTRSSGEGGQAIARGPLLAQRAAIELAAIECISLCFAWRRRGRRCLAARHRARVFVPPADLPGVELRP